MIDSAQHEWSEISDLDPMSSLSLISDQKEKLKELLEDIRQKTEGLITDFPNACKDFLERIMGISESLRVSYAFPGYSESYYILDTLRFIDARTDR